MHHLPSPDENRNDELNYVNMRLVKNSQCAGFYGPQVVSSSVICAVATTPSKPCGVIKFLIILLQQNHPQVFRVYLANLEQFQLKISAALTQLLSGSVFPTYLKVNTHLLKLKFTQADSGGPLVMLEPDGLYTLIGVTSFSEAKSCDKFPVAFSRVPSFLGWISHITNIQIRK
jgi:Trypsin